jgi:hypothetical protein
MSDVSTLPDTPAVAPRHSAALIVAATLAFVGAALTVGALFPDYWDAPPIALVDHTGLLAATVVFAAALILAGALMLGPRSAPIGAAMLVVVVVVGLAPRVFDGVRIAESGGPKAGTGFALITAGFVLAVVAAILGAIVTLRPREWSLGGGPRLLAVLAALTGFAAAVGYGMNPFTVEGAGDGGPISRSFAIGFGSPLEPLPRQLWSALLVVVVLTVVPPIAAAVGRRIGTGLALGLLFGIGGIAALRLGSIYGTLEGRDLDYSAAEGTWTFLAAGGATLIFTFAGIAAGGARGPRPPVRASVQATVPPPAPLPGEPTQPVVVGDTPEAIDYTPDREADTDRDTDPGVGPASDSIPAPEPGSDSTPASGTGSDDTASTRVEPMRSAPPPESSEVPGASGEHGSAASAPDGEGPRD